MKSFDVLDSLRGTKVEHFKCYKLRKQTATRERTVLR